jgi:hypothetical protein
MPRVASPTTTVPQFHVPRRLLAILGVVLALAIAGALAVILIDDDGTSGGPVVAEPSAVVPAPSPSFENRPQEGAAVQSMTGRDVPRSSFDARPQEGAAVQAMTGSDATASSFDARPQEGAAAQAMSSAPSTTRYDGGPEEGTRLPNLGAPAGLR